MKKKSRIDRLHFLGMGGCSEEIIALSISQLDSFHTFLVSKLQLCPGCPCSK